MKQILVINVNWLGDVIFSTPIFKALKEIYPQARIACLAVPRVKEILENTPYLDEIIEYDEEGRHRTPFGKIKLIFSLRGKKFDGVFILHKSLTRALLAFLAGIPVRVGYATKKRGFLLTHRISGQVDASHRVDYYLKVLEGYGVKVNDRRYALDIRQEEKEDAAAILAKEGLRAKEYVLIHPGANWNLKRWPLENFALLIDSLIKDLNVKVVVTGSENDLPLVSQIVNLCEFKPTLLTGKISLKQLMALMQQARLVISADSGPLHMASAVGAGVIGLFGPTRPDVTGPHGRGSYVILQQDVGCNRSPCYYLQCPDNVCMQSITVDDVLNTVKKFRN